MIRDSVYVVTGGAAGLGKAASDALLTAGAYVAVLDLQNPPEDSILRTNEDRVLFFQVDVCSEKEVQNALDATKRKFGKINGVVNCAGMLIKSSAYDFKTQVPFSLQEFTKVIDVNLIGTFNVSRLAVPFMLENKPNIDGERGIILNTSCVLGPQVVPGYLSYFASKFAVKGLTVPMAKELRDYGIRVMDIAPRMITTQMITHKKDDEVGNDLILFRKGEEFGDFVKVIIETPLMNASSNDEFIF